MNNSADETLKELLIGIVFYGIVVQIICFFVTKDLLHATCGLWIGIAGAAGMAVHLKRSIEDALDLGEAGAIKHMRRTYALRYAAIAALFGATVYFKIGHPITLLAGVMGLKIGAYIQPITHKVLKKSK